MADFFRYLVIGLGNGAIYAMIGLGLVVIYRATGLLNFSQGEIAMFTTFIVWSFTQAGIPLWASMLLGVVAGFLIGVVLQRVIIQPFGDPHQKPLTLVIVTIGMFLGINAFAQLIWGTDTKALDPLFGNGQFEIFGVGIAWQKVGALAVLAVEVVVFWLIFQRTKIGLAMRSVASNSESSALVGIPVSRVLMIGWGLAASIGAVAGTFTAVDRGVDSNLMILTLIYALAAITLGGFDSLVGAVVGGLIVGIVTEVVPRYVDFLAKVPLAPAFALILIVLLVRPEGLFGTKRVARV
ncbi:MAG TPA: branched-chain amino acid ABC transporter permease [Microthrixaceae bacterium]|nr:branched-chain amino acid ABC transporter permease [Microthrixaceae bacterium]